MSDRNPVPIDRIRKLLDKAAGTSNPHEADAFARKAAELVALHRIDPDRLAAAGDTDRLSIRDIALGRGAYVRARLALLTAVSEAHDARVVFSSTPSGMLAHIAGFSSDLDLIEVMFNGLHQQAASEMMTIRKATPAATQRFRRAFLFGYAQRIGELLDEARQAVRTSDETAVRKAETALALTERVAEVDRFVSASFPRVRSARQANHADSRGVRAGQQAANGADVGRVRLRGRAAIGPG